MTFFTSDIHGIPLDGGLAELNAIIDSRLTVHTSPLGGYGLFYRNDAVPQTDPEILRIPAKSTLNIHTCMQLLKSAHGQDAAFTTSLMHKGLEFYCARKVSESRIITCYCVCMLALDRLGKLDALDGATFTSKYLQVLLNTKVNNMDSVDRAVLDAYHDSFNTSLFESVYAQRVSGENEEFARLIQEIAGQEAVTPEEIQTLSSAVHSRILEIPREAGGDDFVVDITLVPLLDFANHDNSRLNAYFDVDRTNGDVLLKLDAAQIVAGTQEVFISYAPVEDIGRFFLNYGFIPRSEGDWKVFEVPFWTTANIQLLVKFDSSHRVADVMVNLLDDYSFTRLLPHSENMTEEQIMAEASEDEIDSALKELLVRMSEYMEMYGEKSAKLGNANDLVAFQAELAKAFVTLFEQRVGSKRAGARDILSVILSPDQCLDDWAQMRMAPL